MESIKKLVSGKDDLINDLIRRRKYVSHEHQDFGLRIASKLGDTDKASLYIKLSKEKPRALIMQAFSFAVDYPQAKNRGKLFMWKLKELEKERAGSEGQTVTDELKESPEKKERAKRSPSKVPPKVSKRSGRSKQNSPRKKKGDILEGDQITFT